MKKVMIFLGLSSAFISLFCAEIGMVIAPVVDLVGAPLLETKNPVITYDTIEWSCRRNDYPAIPRLHQLLLHEMVIIKKRLKNEVLISIPHLFYISHATHTPQCDYWTRADNIIPLSSIKSPLCNLPAPLSYKQPRKATHCNTVTLIEPFKDPVTGETFSAGTRFVKADAPSFKTVAAYRFDPLTKKTRIISIPRSICYENQKEKKEERIADFIAILQRWARRTQKTIPYVLGGCSFTRCIAEYCYSMNSMVIDGQQRFYYKQSQSSDRIKTGFDCSGVIARAAQIVGIPYYFKNTYTLLHALAPIKQLSDVCAGDLMWIDGHVLILSDIKKNLIIEAHSYDGDFGKLHEMPLENLFHGIHTIADLWDAYCNKKRLQRLNRAGTVYKSYAMCTLLSMKSAWDFSLTRLCKKSDKQA